MQRSIVKPALSCTLSISRSIHRQPAATARCNTASCAAMPFENRPPAFLRRHVAINVVRRLNFFRRRRARKRRRSRSSSSQSRRSSTVRVYSSAWRSCLHISRDVAAATTPQTRSSPNNRSLAMLSLRTGNEPHRMRYPICKTQWDIALTLWGAFVTVDSSG